MARHTLSPPLRRRAAVLGGRVDRYWAAVAGLLLLALGLRVALVLGTNYFGFHRNGVRGPFDPLEYHLIASSIAEGTGFRGLMSPVEAFRPPGYPYFLAGLYELFGTGDIEAARLVQAGVGTVAVALIGVIGRQLFDRTVALVAMAIAAIYLPLMMVGSSLLADGLFVPVLLGAVAAALAYRRSDRIAWAVLAGALAGVATLVRGNGAVVVVALAVLVAIRPRRRPWRALAASAALVAAAALTVAPWTIRNLVVLDSFVPVNAQDGYTLAGTYNKRAAAAKGSRRGEWIGGGSVAPYSRYWSAGMRGEMDGLEVQRRMRRHALEFARDRPEYVLEVGFWNLVRLLDLGSRDRTRYTTRAIGLRRDLADASVWFVWVVAALALVGALGAGVRRAPAALWLVPGLLLLSVVFVTSSTPRIRAPLDPFLILLAALGACAVAGRARAATGRAVSAARRRGRARGASSGGGPPP